MEKTYIMAKNPLKRPKTKILSNNQMKNNKLKVKYGLNSSKQLIISKTTSPATSETSTN